MYIMYMQILFFCSYVRALSLSLKEVTYMLFLLLVHLFLGCHNVEEEKEDDDLCHFVFVILLMLMLIKKKRREED